LFFVEEANEFIVLLDGLEGFNEDGLARGGRTVDDSGHLTLELGLDWDDKTIAADGNEVVLSAPAFSQATERLAETLFDRAMLAFHGAADAAEFGRCVVVEAAIGFNLATQEAEERGQIVVEERGRELGDTGPVVAVTVGRRGDEVAPCGDAFDDGEKVAYLVRFKGGTVDASFVEEWGGIEEATELEAATAGKHGAQLGGALLLLVDPPGVGAGFKRKHPGAA
jgi:hypothetical protein